MRLSVAMVAAAALLGLSAASASAECRLRVDTPISSWSIRSYDPLGDDVAYGEFELTLDNDGDTACQGVIRAELLGEPWGLRAGRGGRAIPYRLVDLQSGRELTPRSGQTRPTIAGEIEVAPGSRITRRVALSIEPALVNTHGQFQQTVSFLFQDKTLMDVARRDVLLELDSVASATVTLAGAVARGAAGRVNLGELSPGRVDVPLQLQVRSTGGYEVGVSSQNAGRLMLDDSGWTIDYGMVLNGERVSLAEPTSVRVAGQSARSDIYRLGFDIGDVAGRRAGEYSDVITVTVAPL